MHRNRGAAWELGSAARTYSVFLQVIGSVCKLMIIFFLVFVSACKLDNNEEKTESQYTKA